MDKMDLVSISFYFSIWGCFCLLLVSDWIIQDFRLRPPNTSDWLELTLVRPIANKLYVYGQEEYHKKSLKMALSQKMLENFHVSKINRYSKSLSWAENLLFTETKVLLDEWLQLFHLSECFSCLLGVCKNILKEIGLL